MLPHAFVWALYIYMGKMLRIHILDISSIIQLNWNLMMSIRAPSRHKIAKLADRKSKMATTAAILKISFQHLFPNFWWLWAETCCVATGSKELKFCWMEFQDGHNGSTPLNKMAARATNRKPSNDISSWPVARFQNICIEVFLQWPSTEIAKMVTLGWTKWWLELKIEKLYGQWPDFKVISQKCFSYSPLPKLLKKFRSAEQNCHQS